MAWWEAEWGGDTSDRSNVHCRTVDEFSTRKWIIVKGGEKERRKIREGKSTRDFVCKNRVRRKERIIIKRIINGV